jgi:hypothetical protein
LCKKNASRMMKMMMSRGAEIWEWKYLFLLIMEFLLLAVTVCLISQLLRFLRTRDGVCVT